MLANASRIRVPGVFGRSTLARKRTRESSRQFLRRNNYPRSPLLVQAYYYLLIPGWLIRQSVFWCEQGSKAKDGNRVAPCTVDAP